MIKIEIHGYMQYILQQTVVECAWTRLRIRQRERTRFVHKGGDPSCGEVDAILTIFSCIKQND